MECIVIKDLTFKYDKSETVLNKLNIVISKGSIYGFLGPNGSGKTTTLKILLGLLKRYDGEISIFGKSIEKNRKEILKNVGVLIETPSLYSNLTAFENLCVFQKIYGCSKNRINEVLDIVKLSNESKKRTGQFSLGMKQRLGIAIALLHNPLLLILDEPINGLDPTGIFETREILKNINSEYGTTILISSHLLSEIEKLVTHVGIINKGNLVFQGSYNELDIKYKQVSHVIETNDITKTCNILKENNITFEIVSNQILFPVVSKEKIAQLIAKFVSNNIEVYNVSLFKNDLESIFMNIIKK